MQSPHSQQPPVTAKPRGTFLRKKMAEFGFGSSSKSSSSKGLMGIGSKNHSNESVNSTGNDGSSNDKSEPNANNSAISNVTTPITTTTTTSSIPLAANNKSDKCSVTSNISNKVNSNSEPKNASKNANGDGNSRKCSFDSSTQESHMQTGHNGSFSAATRIMNESSCASSTGEASSFITASSSSSSSHRQRLHRQITTTSEMKTSCVKSDLTELKSSLSEMKNLSFNTKFRKSIENILDSRDNVVGEDNGVNNLPSGEPLITYPESPTPNSNTNMVTFPCQNDAVSSRKSSIATEESCCTSPSAASSAASELKFEQRRVSSASKTKLITEQFKTEESLRNEMELKRLQSCDQFAYKEQIANTAVQANKISEKTLDAMHEQRTLAIGDLTQQQTQNVCSAKVRLQADSFSAEKIQKAAAQQQQRQTITSSVTGGVFNKEKVITHSSSNFSSSKGFSTSVSHMQQFSNNATNNFLRDEINNALQVSRQDSFTDYMNENFDDLNKLLTNANANDVETAIKKYTTSIEHVVKSLKESTFARKSMPSVLNKMSQMMTKAWLIPTHGHQLGNSLCNALREYGGLSLLISNCDSNDDDIKFSSAKLLEQCLTTENRAFVVENGLEKVVQVACIGSKNASTPDHSRVRTGILEHLFKHSEGTCEDVIRLGGLDAVIYECRRNDVETLRHCASALANLSLYGGADNQEAMIKREVPVWLFPLAFHDDDNIKYYACLAIAVLVANKEIEADVLKSGTLNLVEPFITSHNPSEFAKSNLSHAHGQSKNWLQRLVPVLSSKREEARNLAAFHFCMEAGIKKSQGNTEVFREIGAIERLKQVASCPNAIASKFAAQALRLIGEVVPHKLIQQVPLWSVEDVKEWVMQIGFTDYSTKFEESRVDGDLLLRLTDENLINDIGILNGIRRQRFVRELHNLKKMADYSSRDSNKLNAFLQSIGNEFTVYTYSMLNAGVDKESIKSLTAEQLQNECGIVNGIHRLRILDSIKAGNSFTNTFEQDSDKQLDVFISYRRSNGSQLASLLKVHLQLRKLAVFIDVEKLEAGKFDNNLLQSIKQAKNFLLVLTPNALDRCLGDVECKDWVHREIVAALESHCKIIPITDNFEWPEPEKLPEDMRAICHFNGIRWIHDYQDACVDKIERFMKGEGGYRNDPGSEVYSGCGIHGTRLMKNESQISGSSSPKSPPSYQRTHSSDSGKRSDDSLQD